MIRILIFLIVMLILVLSTIVYGLYWNWKLGAASTISIFNNNDKISTSGKFAPKRLKHLSATATIVTSRTILLITNSGSSPCDIGKINKPKFNSKFSVTGDSGE